MDCPKGYKAKSCRPYFSAELTFTALMNNILHSYCLNRSHCIVFYTSVSCQEGARVNSPWTAHEILTRVLIIAVFSQLRAQARMCGRLLMSPEQLSPSFFLSVIYAWLWLRSAFLFEPVTRPDSKAFPSKQLGPCLSASCFCTEINHASSIFAVQQRMGIGPSATAQTAPMGSTEDHGIPRVCPAPHPCNCLLLSSSSPLLASASSAPAHTRTKGH